MLVVKSHIGGVESHKLTFLDFLYLLGALLHFFYSFIQWITGFHLTNKPLLFIYIIIILLLFIIYY